LSSPKGVSKPDMSHFLGTVGFDTTEKHRLLNQRNRFLTICPVENSFAEQGM